jgi:hypothetical protein
MVVARLLRWVLPALALGLASCGSSSDNEDRFKLTTPKAKATPTAQGSGGGSTQDLTRKEPITKRESAVIRGWSNSLRSGHIARAARYFSVPAVVSPDGAQLYKLNKRADAEIFNKGLPCGGKVIDLKRSVHHFVLATFLLSERPGPQFKGASCGSGVGGSARAAFLIRHGHIQQWLRVADAPSTEDSTGSS